jgi:hypothetical protein
MEASLPPAKEGVIKLHNVPDGTAANFTQLPFNGDFNITFLFTITSSKTRYS